MPTPGTSEELRAELAALERDLEREKRRRASERARLQSRIDVLTEQALSESAQVDRLRGLVRSLEGEIAELTAGIATVRSDVERVAASRAWRLGHGLAMITDRLRMRRAVTGGAVVSALAALTALERRVTEIEPPGAGNRGTGTDDSTSWRS
jgi:chromosome segregation ATPase